MHPRPPLPPCPPQWPSPSNGGEAAAAAQGCVGLLPDSVASYHSLWPLEDVAGVTWAPGAGARADAVRGAGGWGR